MWQNGKMFGVIWTLFFYLLKPFSPPLPLLLLPTTDRTDDSDAVPHPSLLRCFHDAVGLAFCLPGLSRPLGDHCRTTVPLEKVGVLLFTQLLVLVHLPIRFFLIFFFLSHFQCDCHPCMPVLILTVTPHLFVALALVFVAVLCVKMHRAALIKKKKKNLYKSKICWQDLKMATLAARGSSVVRLCARRGGLCVRRHHCAIDCYHNKNRVCTSTCSRCLFTVHSVAARKNWGYTTSPKFGLAL